MGGAVCSQESKCGSDKVCSSCAGAPFDKASAEYEPKAQKMTFKESLEAEFEHAIGRKHDGGPAAAEGRDHHGGTVADAAAAIAVLPSAAVAAVVSGSVLSNALAAAGALASELEDGWEAEPEDEEVVQHGASSEAGGGHSWAAPHAAEAPKGAGFGGPCGDRGLDGMAALAKAEVHEIADWVHESHVTLRFVCLCLALALLASSALSLLNIFSAVLHPFQYLFAAYNVVFAGVIVALDGRSLKPCQFVAVRRRIFEAVWILSSSKGKGLLYIYVGSINLIMLPDSGLLKLIYQVIGGSLCAAGVTVVLHGCACCRRFQRSQGIDLHQLTLQHGAEAALDKMHAAGVVVRLEFIRIKAFVHSNPVTLKVICCFIGAAMFTLSLLSVVNIFGIFADPYQWLIGSYNLAFSAVIVLIDGPREWLDQCWPARVWVFKAAPCLGWLTGRAIFLFYVGSLNLVVLPDDDLWRWLYWGLGGSLCVAGALMLLHRFVFRSKALDAMLGPAEDG